MGPSRTDARDRRVILVVCGPPGVGKTTVATRLRDRLETRGETVRVHHSDDVSRRTYERLYDRAVDDPDDAITIVDGTFYRAAWQERFRGLEDVRFVHLTANLETCLERNRARPDPIDEQGVHVVYREFDEPDDALEIDTDERDVEEGVDEVVAALERWGWLAADES